ncbi:MAG: N-acetylmuramoyl-L-alanine amidase [Oligoflexia bacterium]|nr:N-acetylmuramoyl-L-alanine amidase [Oligoflexia bacterium]
MLKRFSLFILPLIIIMFVLRLVAVTVPKQAGKKNNVQKTAATVKTGPKKTEYPGAEQRNRKGLHATGPVIVVDPGHGGDDRGKQGIGNITESDVNLRFAFILARALRMKGIRVYLTRTADYNVGYENRLETAIEHDPALFISIHCAYSDNNTEKGLNIFGFTPVRGELEKFENDESSLANFKYEVKTEEARKTEERIAAAVREKTDLNESRMLRRGFFIPVSQFHDIPAFMVFIGFLSSEIDVRNLSGRFYMERIAAVFADAVEKGLYSGVNG